MGWCEYTCGVSTHKIRLHEPHKTKGPRWCSCSLNNRNEEEKNEKEKKEGRWTDETEGGRRRDNQLNVNNDQQSGVGPEGDVSHLVLLCFVLCFVFCDF